MSGPKGDSYVVSSQDYHSFHKNGFATLPAVMSDEEMAREIDTVYEKFLAGEVEVVGRDLCDMSGAKGRSPDEFSVYNVMLPRTYYPRWQGNLYERRCRAIANQLQGGDMDVDFDQILAKRPHSEDAVFAWHQDISYWPPFTQDASTVTCWLAVTDATVDNGCMRFVPGSHLEPTRPHFPVSGSREDSHALYTPLKANDTVVHQPVPRGWVTVHSQATMHGSGPNMTGAWRKAYVMAFRKTHCIAEERRHGFHHSHNDDFNWDTWSASRAEQ